MKKITAVEWLVERLLVDCVPLTQRDIDKAKHMEKEQMKKVFEFLGFDEYLFEQYYNETYGK